MRGRGTLNLWDQKFWLVIKCQSYGSWESESAHDESCATTFYRQYVNYDRRWLLAGTIFSIIPFRRSKLPHIYSDCISESCERCSCCYSRVNVVGASDNHIPQMICMVTRQENLEFKWFVLVCMGCDEKHRVLDICCQCYGPCRMCILCHYKHQGNAEPITESPVSHDTLLWDTCSSKLWTFQTLLYKQCTQINVYFITTFLLCFISMIYSGSCYPTAWLIPPCFPM